MKNRDKDRLDWHPYSSELWHRQRLPAEYRPVLVLCENKDPRQGESICVGYIKFGAGCKDSPYFVTPGMMGARGRVLAWADVLPDVEVYPLWQGGRDAAMRQEKKP